MEITLPTVCQIIVSHYSTHKLVCSHLSHTFAHYFLYINVHTVFGSSQLMKWLILCFHAKYNFREEQYISAVISLRLKQINNNYDRFINSFKLHTLIIFQLSIWYSRCLWVSNCKHEEQRLKFTLLSYVLLRDLSSRISDFNQLYLLYLAFCAYAVISCIRKCLLNITSWLRHCDMCSDFVVCFINTATMY